MIVYMNLENLLKEKNISKNKLCEACNLTTVKIKSPGLISQFLPNSVNFWIVHQMIF